MFELDRSDAQAAVSAQRIEQITSLLMLEFTFQLFQYRIDHTAVLPPCIIGGA
jgi:hypothetical protein